MRTFTTAASRLPHRHYYAAYHPGLHLDARVIVIAVLVLAGIHLAGGLAGHARHRRHGLRPDLSWTYGRGWYGTVALPGGFRLGHRVGISAVLTLAVIIGVVIIAVHLAGSGT